MKIYNVSATTGSNFYTFQNKDNCTFKGGHKKDDNTSKQKNDPDNYINPAIFYHLQAQNVSENTATFNLHTPFFDTDFYMEDEKEQENDSADFIAKTLIATADYLYKQLPEDKIDNIPSFIKTDIEGYFKSFDALDEEMKKDKKKLEESLSQSDIFTKYPKNNTIKAKVIKGIQENIPDFSSFGKILKEKNYDGIKAALEKIDKVQNYKCMLALDAGFECNPRRVINILSNSALNISKPIIEDNKDGTSKYTYATFNNIVETTKNNNNGDFIDFSIGYRKEISGKFNKNGTIEEMSVKNKYDGTTTKFTQNLREKTVSSTTDGKRLYTHRVLEKIENGTYKTIDLLLLHNYC